MRQEHEAAAIAIATDLNHDGAWATRQRALNMSATTWTAFLDDDDLMYPMHLRRLMEIATALDADYVYSYWDLSLMGDFLGHFGRPFDPSNPTHTTMTILVKTDLAHAVGFSPPDPADIAGGEDWRFCLGCVALGATIVHLPEQTWVYSFHPDGADRNTSGQPHLW